MSRGQFRSRGGPCKGVNTNRLCSVQLREQGSGVCSAAPVLQEVQRSPLQPAWRVSRLGVAAATLQKQLPSSPPCPVSQLSQGAGHRREGSRLLQESHHVSQLLSGALHSPRYRKTDRDACVPTAYWRSAITLGTLLALAHPRGVMSELLAYHCTRRASHLAVPTGSVH